MWRVSAIEHTVHNADQREEDKEEGDSSRRALCVLPAREGRYGKRQRADVTSRKANGAQRCPSLPRYGHNLRKGKLRHSKERKVKAIENFLRSAELGLPKAYLNLASYYVSDSDIVTTDTDKFFAMTVVGAMKGSHTSRHTLGVLERDWGNIPTAIKHWEIAASAGFQASLDELKKLFRSNDICKDDFRKTLGACLAAQAEEKTDERTRYAKFEKTGIIED